MEDQGYSEELPGYAIVESAVFENLLPDIDHVFDDVGWYVDTEKKGRSQVSSYDLGWEIEFCDPKGFFICIDEPFDMALPISGDQFVYTNSQGQKVTGKITPGLGSQSFTCSRNSFELIIQNTEVRETNRFTFDEFLGLTEIEVTSFIDGTEYGRFHQSLKSGGVFKLREYCRKRPR